ncbi:MAG: endonuclease/exonuclease/phosphatase family protein [Caldilineaceae bacterium]
MATPATAATLTPIYAIQGDGLQSPLIAQWVDTYGVVTGVIADGFYLQDPQGDGNPQSSDGIYVYTRERPTVQVGQCVQVQRAYVDEFYGKTELSRIKAASPVGLCPTVAIAPAQITPASLTQDPAATFERFEGMVVGLDRLEGFVQGATKHFAGGEMEIAFVTQSQLPFLDGNRVFQDDPHAMRSLMFLSNELGAALPEARWGDTLLVGDPSDAEVTVYAILDYNFGKYQLLLWPDTTSTIKRFSSPLPPLTITPPTTADDFTVCTYNAHGMGRGSEQYWEPQEYDRQLAKRARTIAEALQGCTIIGLQELGKPEDAMRLATLLADGFGLEYAAVALPGPNTLSNEFPLTNSLLARTDRVQIVTSAAPQGCSPIDYEVERLAEDCPPGQFPLFNRPPLVVELMVAGTWGEPFPITVIVNHWKSKGGDEQINVVRRTAQATHVARLVQEKLNLNPTANLMVLGDLNDYYGSGPVETLRTGTNPALTHSYQWLPPLDRYTYVFNGGSQVLDHILITPHLDSRLARVDPVHMNADYPSGDESQVALLQRSSDHDPVLVQIRPAGVGILGGNLGFPAINITLSTADGAEVAQTTTDALGDFRFWALPPGEYQFHIDASSHFNQNAQTGILTIVPGYQTIPPALFALPTKPGRVPLLQLAPLLISQIQAQSVPAVVTYK